MKAGIATKASTFKQLGKLSFIITVKIMTPKGTKDVVALFNSGTKANFIHKHWAKSINLELNKEN